MHCAGFYHWLQELCIRISYKPAYTVNSVVVCHELQLLITPMLCDMFFASPSNNTFVAICISEASTFHSHQLHASLVIFGRAFVATVNFSYASFLIFSLC